MQILYGKDAREQIFNGVEKLAKAVKCTLGPRGRNVMYRTLHGGIRNTKDGVTVAKQVNSSNEAEKMGIETVLQASMQSNQLAGDGTTTSTLIAYNLVKEAKKLLDKRESGVNVTKIRKGMMMACKRAVELLNEMKLDVTKDEDMIRNVATISANNDEFIGSLIAEAYSAVGMHGNVKADTTKGPDTYYDVNTGMQFPVGYYSPYFCTDTDTKQMIYTEGVGIFVVRDKITEYETTIVPIINYSKNKKTPIVIIADEVDNSVLGQAVFERLKNSSNVSFIKAPYFSARRDDCFEDLCALTGATMIGSKYSTSLKDKTITSYLGHIDTVAATNKAVVFSGTNPDSDKLKSHLAELKRLSETAKTKFEKDRYNERIAKLRGGVATIYVGGSSPVEVGEKKDRVDDAIHAIEAASEEGVVPGGGIALLRVMHLLKFDDIDDADVKIGFEIFASSIMTPFTQILVNAGKTKEEIEAIYKEVIKNKDNKSYGYDSNAEIFTDFKEKGILDPKKVTRIALENAVSVAGVVLTTECALVDNSIQAQEEQLASFGH